MKQWLSNIFFSFPIQLVVLHLRAHLLLTFIWGFLMLFITGSLASKFGIKYLFLDPEYMGNVDFLSFYIVGIAFGSFFMTWNLTTYLLAARHFPFLATLARPFTKYCLNNFIIPLTFLTVYFAAIIKFQRYYEYWAIELIVYNCLGFILGWVSVILITGLYLSFTNKDIKSFALRRTQLPPNLVAVLLPSRRTPNMDELKQDEKRWRVKLYLTESLRLRLVRSVAHYDSSVLQSIFKQNHINALVIQLFGLMVLLVFGYLIDHPHFRIPASASAFILMSILISISGAVTYWFDEWRAIVFIIVLIGINTLTSYDLFNHKNKAYGLNYDNKLAYYNHEELYTCARSYIAEDKENMIGILENWRAKFGKKKPKMGIVCVSGGGMKASVWAMHVLQQADSLMQGNLFKNTFLMSGASGGIIGTAYLRELYLRKQLGDSINIYDQRYLDNISKDLLNSITFTIVTNDLFVPWVDFKVGEHTYRKDRGYIFEQQLNENTNYVLDKRLIDYQQPEKDALIPLLFITPSIVNDGRRLVISSQGTSFMSMPPIGYEQPGSVDADAVDFLRLFEQQDAPNLRYTTALRMNATYPYILPNVYLPSEPGVEVMDAGFRDNYGLNSALRFMHVFKDWILENTSGVVLLQIVGKDRQLEIEASDSQGAIESILNPLGIASKVLSLQQYEQDTNVGMMYDLLGHDNFEVLRFTYRPSKENEEASMTFHLTKREKQDIQNAIYQPDNQQNLKRLHNSILSKKTKGKKNLR